MNNMEYRTVRDDSELVEKMVRDGWQVRFIETGNLSGKDIVYLMRPKTLTQL